MSYPPSPPKTLSASTPSVDNPNFWQLLVSLPQSLMRIAVLEELGWDHWAAHYRAWRVVDAPASLALF